MDPQTSSIPSPTPGAQTSEFALTKYVTIVGGVLTLIFSTLTQVQMSGLLPEQGKVAQVLAGILAVVAMLLTVLKALGYTNSRSEQKTTFTQATAALAVAQFKASQATIEVTAQPAAAPQGQPTPGPVSVPR